MGACSAIATAAAARHAEVAGSGTSVTVLLPAASKVFHPAAGDPVYEAPKVSTDRNAYSLR